jgi:hypothetical protein
MDRAAGARIKRLPDNAPAVSRHSKRHNYASFYANLKEAHIRPSGGKGHGSERFADNRRGYRFPYGRWPDSFFPFIGLAWKVQGITGLIRDRERFRRLRNA